MKELTPFGKDIGSNSSQNYLVLDGRVPTLSSRPLQPIIRSSVVPTISGVSQTLEYESGDNVYSQDDMYVEDDLSSKFDSPLDSFEDQVGSILSDHGSEARLDLPEMSKTLKDLVDETSLVAEPPKKPLIFKVASFLTRGKNKE